MAEEAKQIKSAFESGDVVSALTRAGKSKQEIRQIMEDRLLELIEEENLDPREREIRDLKRFKEQTEKERKEETDRASRLKQEKEVKRLRESMAKELVDSIQKSNLPKTPQIFKRIASEMQSAYEKGYEMSASEATKIVEQDIIEEYQALLPNLGVERIKKALGEDNLKKLREEQVRSVKEATPSFAKPKQAAKSSVDNSVEPEEKVDMTSFFRNKRRGL
jgi:hypothetical protein